MVMPATMGPCRLGEYGELLKSILDRQGYSFQWILLDSVSAIGRKELLHRLSQATSSSPSSEIEKLQALRRVYRIIKEFEKLEQRARIQCGFEINRGESLAIIKTCRSNLEKAPNSLSALKLIHRASRALLKVHIDEAKSPIKLIVTGEIFTSIDSFGNQHLEERLMEMGISFEKRISLGWWIDNTIINPFGSLIAEKRPNVNMPYCIGGYAKETVSEAIRCKKKGCDGIIHLLPVGCMPEIVAKSVFDGLNRTEGLPVLSIVYDEMSGEAGYITRIEAFIDMLERRKTLEA